MECKAVKEIQAKMKTWTDAGIELAYNSGYEQGCQDRDEIYAEDKEDYNRGLNDAWECARKIYKMTASEIIAVFGGCSNWVDYSADEAIKMIEEYEEEYEEEKQMDNDIYPLTVIKDRYRGTYSGGEYLAFNLDCDEIPEDVIGSDVPCRQFFYETDLVYGKGSTIDEAIKDLYRQIEEGGSNEL